MPSVSKWMVGYGLFLIVCGLAAFVISGFAGRALTAVIVGGATGFLAILMGVLSAADNHKVKMIGIHLGLVFILLFALLFTGTAVQRWTGAFEEDGVLYLPIVLTIMAVGSFVTLVMVLRLRPPMQQRAPEGDEQ